eukprot:757846-Hanusia_phi.AAC.2
MAHLGVEGCIRPSVADVSLVLKKLTPVAPHTSRTLTCFTARPSGFPTHPSPFAFCRVLLPHRRLSSLAVQHVGNTRHTSLRGREAAL